jgi:RHS repeat-associated protein
MKKTLKITAVLTLFLLSIAAQAQQVQVITDDAQKTQYESKSYLVVKSLTLKPGFTASASSTGAWYAKIHPNATAPSAPSADQNFIKSEGVLINGVTTEAQVRSLSIVDKSTSFSYMDGVGRPLQSTIVSSSPGLNDIVQPTFYDNLGRPSRQYLPYTTGGTPGAYRSSALSDQSNFYNNGSDKIADDSRTYSDVSFDDSPLGRVTQSRATGSAWATAHVYNNVKINDAGTVRVWNIVSALPSSTSFYPAGTLAISEVQDEEGSISRSYADFMGRTILKEVQAPGGKWAQTYYVYNAYGNIQFIIPPGAVEICVAANNFSPDITFVNRWYFQYEYDEYQRQTGSKVPGTGSSSDPDPLTSGWVYTIYDQWDRPVLTQDANQRAKATPEWNFVKYDDLNRPVISGIYASSSSRASLTTTLATFSGRYEVRNTSAEGYSLNQTFPTTVSESNLLSIAYFDDYSFKGNFEWDKEGNSYNFVPETGYTGTVFLNGNGSVLDMPTGGKVKILNGIWLNSVTYYDNQYRPIQSISENHFSAGGAGKTDRLTTEYDFSGKVLKTKRAHNNNAISIQERFAYDHRGRVLKTYHQVNSQPEVLLSAFEYNELGQVIDKKIHSENGGANYLQSVDYRYNIRGWNTNINNTTADSGDPIDYFGTDLAYNTSQSNNTTRLDGAITGARSKHDLSSKDRVFNYTYDKGAMTGSTYKVNNTANTQSNVLDETISYDVNGNIQSLNRKGGGATSATIDDLTYNYGSSGGNQLMKVTDVATTSGFKDGNTVGDDYEYDLNGNLTRDKNKGITITYNFLDLPEQVAIVSGTNTNTITYTYDASGEKLSQLYHYYDIPASAWKDIKTDYSGGFIYVDGQPQILFHDQGRLVPASYANLISNTATREANSLAGYTANGSVTLTNEAINGNNYVKAVSNQSGGTPGIFQLGNTITVKAGESYSFKVLGCQSVGTNAYLYVSGNNGDIVWTGAQLPIATSNESTFVTSTFTIPAGVTQIKVGVLWNNPASGNTFLINRVAVYKTDWEYQYFLADHLGSPRVVLQTAPHTFTYTATMESQNYSNEAQPNGQFQNINSGNEIVFVAANATAGGTRAYVMNSTYHTGPSRSFKVLPGDIIDASVMAYYAPSGSYSKTGLAAMGSAVAGALSGGILTVDGKALNSAYTNTGNGNFPGLLLSPDQGTAKPSAFLNYILFDETYTPLEAKSQPVGNVGGVLHQLVMPTVSVQQTGYLYVYLSYDNATGPDVYFDELKITYQESPVVQVNSYYSYGMPSMSWIRSGENENVFLYQGKELNAATGLYDFHARQYDASLGRWFSTDPKGQFGSPYLAMGNSPAMGVDPDGQWVNFAIGAVVGGIGGYSTGKALGKSGWDLFKFTIAGAGIGAATAGIGTAITAGTSAALGTVGSTLVGGTVAGAFNGAAMSGLGGGNIGQGALYGSIGGLAGSTAGLANINGIVPGALYGAATGGLISGGISSLSGGSFGDGFRSGAISGGILGGINGGILASQSKYERNIIFGGATRNGKQNYLNDLATSSDAYSKGLNKVELVKSLGKDENAVTRPIINGAESDLNTYLLGGSGAGTESNVYVKNASLRALASTFGHEMVHVNDYFTGYAKMTFIRSYIQNRSVSLAFIYSKNHLEYRAYQSNINFGYRRNQYQIELNKYLLYK